MADEHDGEEQAPGGPAPSGGQAPPPAPQPPQAGAGAQPAMLRSKDGKVWTLDAAVAHIDDLTREAASHRKGRQTAEQERDTLRQERDEAQAKLRERDVRDLAATEAGKARARNPAAVAKLVSMGAVLFDDKGTPTNLDKLIEAIRKEFPELFATGSADGATPRTGVGIDMNQMIRQAARR